MKVEATVSGMDFEADEGETGGGDLEEADERGGERLSEVAELDVSESSSSESTTGSAGSPTEKRRFAADGAFGGTVANCRRDNAAEESSKPLIFTL